VHEYVNAKFYQANKRRKLRKNLEQLTLTHYESILDFNLCKNLSKDAKLAVQENAENLVLFKPTVTKLIDDWEYYEVDPNLYETVLTYTKSIMEQNFSWRIALYGAVFGALAAFIVQYFPDIINALNKLF
jgi:hypothetical protein